MANYKKFSKADYNKHDKPAKIAAAKFLKSRGLRTAATAMDAYTFDLWVKADDLWIQVEVEHKTGWKNKQWPSNWESVDVPHRKWKNTALLYILFNNKYDACGIAKMREVQAASCSRKDTTITNNELFFNVSFSA